MPIKVIHESEVSPTIFTGRESRRLVTKERDGSTRMSFHIVTVNGAGTSKTIRYENNDEIQYCLEGEGEIIVGRRKYKFVPGSAVFVPAGCSYRISHETPMKMVAVISPPRLLSEWKNCKDLVKIESTKQEGRRFSK